MSAPIRTPLDPRLPGDPEAVLQHLLDPLLRGEDL